MEEIFKALSEESRLRIITLLLNGEMCVCELEACLNLSQSNVSRHLTALKRCGILDSYKKAQWVYYAISERFIEENFELWNYLIRKLKEMPNYKANCEQCIECKKQNLCNQK